jgi:hypothetical protein
VKNLQVLATRVGLVVESESFGSRGNLDLSDEAKSLPNDSIQKITDWEFCRIMQRIHTRNIM